MKTSSKSRDHVYPAPRVLDTAPSQTANHAAVTHAINSTLGGALLVALILFSKDADSVEALHHFGQVPIFLLLILNTSAAILLGGLRAFASPFWDGVASRVSALIAPCLSHASCTSFGGLASAWILPTLGVARVHAASSSEGATAQVGLWLCLGIAGISGFAACEYAKRSLQTRGRFAITITGLAFLASIAVYLV